MKTKDCKLHLKNFINKFKVKRNVNNTSNNNKKIETNN